MADFEPNFSPTSDEIREVSPASASHHSSHAASHASCTASRVHVHDVNAPAIIWRTIPVRLGRLGTGVSPVGILPLLFTTPDCPWLVTREPGGHQGGAPAGGHPSPKAGPGHPDDDG